VVDALGEGGAEDVAAVIAELEQDMADASARLEFERAAVLRDQINALRSGDFRKAAQLKSGGGSGSGGKAKGKGKVRATYSNKRR
jgi:excinuclease ABC subunit B